MAQKFLSLEEAAQHLGVSKEKLNELREAGRAHAYRDGAGWKFKEEEVHRIGEELREEAEGGELDLDLAGGEDDSILLSEVELGESENSPSTIIGNNDGQPGDGAANDSDLALAGDSDLALAGGDEDDELTLAPTDGDDHVLSADAKAAGDPDDTKGSGLAASLEEIDDLELESLDEPAAEQPTAAAAKPEDEPTGASDLELEGASDLKLEGDSALSLDAGGSDLQLEGSGLLLDDEEEITAEPASAAGAELSDVALAPGESAVELSGVELADDEDDELVLGEGAGSDLTLGASDSGISLGPSDSGISLDEAPLELGGSAVEALDLSEDDDAVVPQEDAGSEDATQLKSDEGFLLTPLDDAAGDADDDSSQVIALDSESFDESAATLLGGDDLFGGADAEGMLAESAPAEGDFAAAGAPGAALAAGGAAPAGGGEPAAPYTVWNILSLTLCVMLLSLTGMMLFDLVRNIWSWNEPYAMNSTIMDGLVQAIPIFK
jgi:excisionase family DNA binding protein